MTALNELLRKIPKVDEIFNNEKIQETLNYVPRVIVIDSIRLKINQIRNEIVKLDNYENYEINILRLIDEIIIDVKKNNQMRLKKVINTTGVVLHTNLGRSLLSDYIKEDMWNVANNYSTLEYDVDTGKRGSRYSHVEDIIKKVTGCEDVLVVNNNAAAVLLILNTIAKDKQVIVSRGELVEIGGYFRVPDIMEQSGAQLIEVGTTNKTKIEDYEKAIDKDCIGALLKVHTSNYRIMGFTEEVGLKELSDLGKKYNIPVIHDLGSGSLIDFSDYGLYKEPTVMESVASNVDIVCFSGDKLLGGPQAGIILGNKEFIEKMKKNPFTRAFRIDKLTLSALEATMKLYLNKNEAIKKIPTLSMLTINFDELEKKGTNLFDILSQSVNNCIIEKSYGNSQVGGGSFPLQDMPSVIITVKPEEISTQKLEEMLRNCETPIITRIYQDKIVMDVRTIKEDQFKDIVKAFISILN